MNETEVEAFLSPLSQGSSWAAKCIEKLLNAENLTGVAEGLVAQHGQQPVEYVKGKWNAWGIDMKTCHSYCGRSNFPMVFDFPIFTSGVTNYLLPWLGLTAQLPYETGSPSGDFESFCLAVGSPMLTTFSLMSTVRNARTTSKAFAGLPDNNATTTHMKKAIESAEYFLCHCQQSPIRIQDDEFRNLFNGNEEHLHYQWVPPATRLRDTRRPYTFSFFAQTFFAVSAWVLTIVGAYVTSLGQHSQALLLSSGTLWTWLVPIVLGWMAVGMQSRPDTVRDAIRGETTRGRYAPLEALKAESGFISLPSANVKDALFGKVQGDEACQGPIYNYARILTYPRLQERIFCAFRDKLALLPAQEARTDTSENGTELQPLPSGLRVDNSAHVSAGSSTSSRTRAASTGSHRHTSSDTELLRRNPFPGDDMSYMEWKDVRGSSDWIWNFVISNAIAVFLQWGVTGSAIVISYLTEVQGLGCRSGSYLLYGILATSAHMLLLASVFLSHHVMLLYQRHRQPQGDALSQIRSFGRLAVALRYSGKAIVVANAIWIILSSVFELIGFYESCWCTGTVLGLGDKAWVVLFVSGDNMREDAEASWVGGLAMSLITMILTYFIAKAYTQGRRE